MSFRITDRDQLEHVAPGIRRQLENELDKLDAFHESLANAGMVAGNSGRARNMYPEEAAGRELVKWADSTYAPAPSGQMVLIGDYLAHNANGGARTAVEAAILKGQGVRAGWPDYTLYMPRGARHGAVLELKGEDGAKPTRDQLDVLERLDRMGYAPIIAWGFEQARLELMRYLGL